MLIIITLALLLQPVTHLFAIDSLDSTGTMSDCFMSDDDCDCSSDSVCQQQHCADSFNSKTFATAGCELAWLTAAESIATTTHLAIPSAPYFELLRPPRS